MTASSVTRHIPDAHQRTLIAARAAVHYRTVLRCYEGKPVRSTVARRITEAARALQIPEPLCTIAP